MIDLGTLLTWGLFTAMIIIATYTIWWHDRLVRHDENVFKWRMLNDRN